MKEYLIFMIRTEIKTGGGHFDPQGTEKEVFFNVTPNKKLFNRKVSIVADPLRMKALCSIVKCHVFLMFMLFPLVRRGYTCLS